MATLDRVLCVVGARPNFIKVAPLMEALRARDFSATLVHTGQHYDSTMSETFFTELRLPEPDRHLGIGSGTHAEQTAGVMRAFEPIVVECQPEVVVVAGDVNSTVACALVAAKAGTLLAHVEAGLRSRDWTMPEEINRVVTDRCSDVLLAPSPDAVEHLRTEGADEGRIFLVGNLMVDTLLHHVDGALVRNTPSRYGARSGEYGLVTLHRPANVDDHTRFARLREGLTRVAARIPLIVPVHPRARPAWEAAGQIPGITLTEPLGYLDFLGLEADAALVLTDSGGVQEETTVLGVPCLTLRSNTERPITITEGTNTLVGDDPETIDREATRVLDSPPEPRRPALWDGHAAERVVDVLAALDPATHPRPTDLARG